MRKLKVLFFVAIILLFSLKAMAVTLPYVVTSNNAVKIEGKLDELNSNVTLIILDGNNERQYLDQVKTDGNGSFKFEFSLKEGQYTGKISTEINQYDIKFEVKKGTSQEPSDPGPGGGSSGGQNNNPAPADVPIIEKVDIKKSFKDIENHWAKNEIELLAGKGIISGMGDDVFKPEEKITRAQFAILLFNLLNLKSENYTGKFADVKESDWFSLFVEAVAKKGIVLGSDGYFHPNKEITREEMAVMIVRAMELREVIIDADRVSFVDKDNISEWAVDSVSKASQKGIIKGMTEFTFEPKQNATRAQASVMIFRLMEVIEGTNR
ncbi:S-layer homology domain-containing protein [Sedimentibacter sp.]|uniref:S-layer homology domain-containing protein n=1 Tax=Sedimentibacter sp. TaxID=1960295 RepID=UPI0028A74B2A|nr:S-layer homology domain-containing protein [Sedimentibacter sp.]